MKTILLIFIIFLAASCQNDFPTITPKERCVTVLMTNEDETYTGFCRCHLYEWTSSNIGRITESTDYELSKCNKLIGFNPDDSAAIYTWEEEIRMWLDRHK